MELSREENLNPSVDPSEAPRVALGAYRFAGDFDGTDMQFVRETWAARFTSEDANPEGKPQPPLEILGWRLFWR